MVKFKNYWADYSNMTIITSLGIERYCCSRDFFKRVSYLSHQIKVTGDRNYNSWRK